jgi:methionyl-tRNA formyltransferase
MNILLFGDESTLPQLCDLLKKHTLLPVLASKRASSQNELAKISQAILQPYIPKKNSSKASAKISDKISDKISESTKLFFERVQKHCPDLILSFSYSQKIPTKILKLSKIAAINVHAGILPQFRGNHIIQWMLIEDAPKMGVTLHHLTERFDAGNIIDQKTFPTRDTDTALDIKNKTDKLGFSLIQKWIEKIEQGETLPQKPQDETCARTYRSRTPEDGFIDWNKTDREIFNLIRALVSPWPGAYCFDHQGKKVVFQQAVSFKEIPQLRQRYKTHQFHKTNRDHDKN